MKCKVCGREQHYCNSCDSDDYLYEGYCDKECFKKSKFYVQEKGQFYNLLDRLDKDSIRVLQNFLDNQDYLLNHSNEYDLWIEEYCVKKND